MCDPPPTACAPRGLRIRGRGRLVAFQVRISCRHRTRSPSWLPLKSSRVGVPLVCVHVGEASGTWGWGGGVLLGCVWDGVLHDVLVVQDVILAQVHPDRLLVAAVATQISGSSSCTSGSSARASAGGRWVRGDPAPIAAPPSAAAEAPPRPPPRPRPLPRPPRRPPRPRGAPWAPRPPWYSCAMGEIRPREKRPIFFLGGRFPFFFAFSGSSPFSQKRGENRVERDPPVFSRGGLTWNKSWLIAQHLGN